MRMNIIDLSYPLTDNMPVFPGDAGFRLRKEKSFEKNSYTEYSVSAGLHTGTHIDAPMHLTEDGSYIGEFPAELFCADGILLNVQNEKEISRKPEYGNAVKEGCAVLLYSGFADMYAEPEKYYGNYPVITEELCELFIRKKIRILGIDFPSPDKAPYILHKRLLENGIFLLENLTNLSVLADCRKFRLYAFPLKLKAEASFVRAVAEITKV